MGCGIAAKIAVAAMDVLVYDSAPAAAKHIHIASAAIFTELEPGGAMNSDESAAAAPRIRVAARLSELATADAETTAHAGGGR